MRHGFLLAAVGLTVACSSGEPSDAPSGDAGAIDPGPTDSGSAADALPASDSGAPLPEGGKDGAASGGGGTCAAPKTVGLGFSETASTSSLLDVTSVACGAPASLSESVYRIVLSQDAAVRITANDESGQGVGVQVREGSCDGTSVECTWSANGDYDKTLPLPAGTWFFVVERAPEGSYTISFAEQ